MHALRVGLMVCISLGGWIPVWGQDLRQALIDSFQAEIQALNTGDLAAAVAPADDNIVVYGLYSPFPIEDKDTFREAVKDYFDSHQSAVLKLVYPRYLVAGQYMLSYAHPAEEWRVISRHFAPLPGLQ